MGVDGFVSCSFFWEQPRIFPASMLSQRHNLEKVSKSGRFPFSIRDNVAVLMPISLATSRIPRLPRLIATVRPMVDREMSDKIAPPFLCVTLMKKCLTTAKDLVHYKCTMSETFFQVRK